ncbi:MULTISPECIES: hypothetical protein [Paenibacillus]|uniref:hypothetical protein n=1 Tax=Paenibacillus TaxID=44249 RepID=UPI0022B901C2|nr:hypothetical protein [Paenibacillus caseinilyticus]MCZ8520955.1 hypothetical protein [Paenibacillus caseinilyticus]
MIITGGSGKLEKVGRGQAAVSAYKRTSGQEIPCVYHNLSGQPVTLPAYGSLITE